MVLWFEQSFALERDSYLEGMSQKAPVIHAGEISVLGWYYQ
jgi:hypothetical protein